MWKMTKKLSARQVPWRNTNSIGLPFRHGRWYGPNEIGTTIQLQVAGRMYAVPVYVPVTSYCQAIGVEVSNLAAGKSLRLGLYADSGGVSGALLTDAGTVSAAVADEVGLPLARWLRAGWYWLAVLSEGAPYLRACSNGTPTRMGVTSNIDTDNIGCVYAAPGWGALPDPFGAPTLGSTSAAPRLLLLAQAGMEDTSDGWHITQDVEYGTQLILPQVSGRYYGCPLNAATYFTRTLALAANLMYAMPFYVNESHAYDRIAVHVTTLKAGSNIQLGIYADSAGVPGDLILDAGNVSGASTGGKEININQTLARGWYWLAAVSDNTPTLRTYQGSSMFGWLGATTGVDTTYYGGMSVAQGYGALPTPFTAGAVLTATGVPRIMLRAT